MESWSMDFYLRLSSLDMFLRFTHVVAMYPLNKYKQKFLSSCKPMSSYSRLALLSNKIPCAIPCDTCITLFLGLGFPSSEPLLMFFLPTRPWILPVDSLLFFRAQLQSSTALNLMWTITSLCLSSSSFGHWFASTLIAGLAVGDHGPRENKRWRGCHTGFMF